ncbi:plasmid partitioning protein RepB C-terminal domain-containing protein [Duganella sp. sic0402]|uniref:plasmid partitioning protein RepB C-terminal domain-containing protein n=1 Tax=Duganella sp. sic0402 TaxID=2854786 RepID=UPI0035A3A95F
MQRSYAQALLVATPSNMVVGETKARKMSGVSADQMAKIEREMGNLQAQFKLAEQSYGQDVLNLVLARGYLAKLMANDSILRHLTKHHPDVLNEFGAIVNMVALDK